MRLLGYWDKKSDLSARSISSRSCRSLGDCSTRSATPPATSCSSFSLGGTRTLHRRGTATVDIIAGATGQNSTTPRAGQLAGVAEPLWSFTAHDSEQMHAVETRGPHSFEYLGSFRSGSQIQGGFEFPIFGDSYFTGSGAQIGPYEIINGRAFDPPRPGYFRPSIVVRCANIDGEYRPSLERTDTSRYHGGDLADEIAALISLALAVRMQAGSVNRQFGSFSSPGQPIGWDQKPWPEAGEAARG